MHRLWARILLGPVDLQLRRSLRSLIAGNRLRRPHRRRSDAGGLVGYADTLRHGTGAAVLGAIDVEGGIGAIISELEPVLSFKSVSWRKELASLPSPEEIETRHRAFSALTFEDASLAAIRKAFHYHYQIFPLTQIQIVRENMSELGLYRARWVDPMTTDISRIAAHSYPPKRYCKALGRANRPGRPVFYASENPKSALFEIGAPSDYSRTLIVSQWKLNQPTFKFFPVLPGEGGNCRTGEVQGQWVDAMRAYLMQQQSGKVDSLMRIFDCLSRLYLGNNYPVTSWLADSVLYRNYPKLDAIVYPSIAKRKQGVCFAIRPSVIDGHGFILKKAFAVDNVSIVYTSTDGDMNVTGSNPRIATVKGNQLEWIQVDDQRQLEPEFAGFMA